MADPSPIDHVVVLGGGYAGLRAALDLAAACRRRSLRRRISLVDCTPYHQLVTSLHRAATEGLDLDASRLPLDELLVPGTVDRRRARVTALAHRDRTVHLDDGEPLSYDRLVVALGSTPARPELEGMREHGFRLRWWADAGEIRDQVRRVLRRAELSTDRHDRRALLTLVVAGGGATGCQLAGELARWLPRLAAEHRIPVDELSLVLVEAGSRLLQEESRESSEYAYETLRRKGVEILLEASVGSVGAGTVRLDGRALPARTVIWTGGVKAPPLLAESGLPVGRRGRVRVDASLRVEGFPEIYVAGDAALFELGGRPLPATAAVAQHQGAFVAEAIVTEMEGGVPAAYRPRDLGRIVSLGEGEAVGTMLGQALRGPGACFVKENIERWYRSTVTRRLPLMDL